MALAENRISNEIEASISNADNGVTTTVGAITLDASEDANITARSAAASATVAVAGIAGVALSGAGAEATNVILTTTNAYAESSSLTSAGDVVLEAADTSVIDATVATASASVAVGGTASYNFV